jgi:iron(III) transport system permease protein
MAAAAAMATCIVATAMAAKLLHVLLDRLVFARFQTWRKR